MTPLLPINIMFFIQLLERYKECNRYGSSDGARFLMLLDSQLSIDIPSYLHSRILGANICAGPAWLSDLEMMRINC